MKNSVYIATSLDRFIADKAGRIDWLETVPNPDQVDMGYSAFISTIEAIVMGRNTYEKVLSFGIEWPYEKPVFVLSTTLSGVPTELHGRVQFLKGNLRSILDEIHSQGYKNLYIDGGNIIQQFLKEDLIDEMIITTIPVLLGDGVPLFGTLNLPLKFRCEQSKVYLDAIAQNHFVRDRSLDE